MNNLNLDCHGQCMQFYINFEYQMFWYPDQRWINVASDSSLKILFLFGHKSPFRLLFQG